MGTREGCQLSGPVGPPKNYGINSVEGGNETRIGPEEGDNSGEWRVEGGEKGRGKGKTNDECGMMNDESPPIVHCPLIAES
jgi:hypothetical protein